MKKKLVFIGLVSCILVLLLGATMVSAAPSYIDVVAGQGKADLGLTIVNSPPLTITIRPANLAHDNITIIPGSGPVS